MDWYRKTAAPVMDYRDTQFLALDPSADPEKRRPPNQTYLSYGHDSNEGDCMWAWAGNRLQVVPAEDASDVDAYHNEKTFPDVDLGRAYTGRYDASTGTVTVSYNRYRLPEPPSALMSALHMQFNPRAINLYASTGGYNRRTAQGKKPTATPQGSYAPEPYSTIAYPPAADPDAGMSNAEAYFGLGHGEENEQGSDPETHQVWILRNGRIEAMDAGPSAHGLSTHGYLWGHDVANNTWKGRYEGDTGRLSIVAPRIGEQMPGLLMGLLQQQFGNIREVHRF